MADIDQGLGSGAPVTPQPTITPSSTPDSGNEGNQSLIQDEANKDWKSEYEKVSQRYSDSSREAQRVREEKETIAREAEEARQDLMRFVTKDRSRFEEYVDSKGLSPKEREYYMNIYDTKIAPNSGSTNSVKAMEGVTDALEGTTGAQTTQPSDPFRESWMSKMDSIEREKWQQQFNASRDFFAKEENKILPSAVQESIKTTAAMLDEVYGYSPSEALEAARKRILNPDDIRDEGYAQGVKDSYQSGVSRGFVGGKSVSKDTVKLPARDEAFVQLEIQRRGLTGEKAEQYRAAYAQRLSK